jgi:hypothetical protein
MVPACSRHACIHTGTGLDVPRPWERRETLSSANGFVAQRLFNAKSWEIDIKVSGILACMSFSVVSRMIALAR